MPDGISFILVGDGQGRVVHDPIQVYLLYIIVRWIFLFLRLSSFSFLSSSSSSGFRVYVSESDIFCTRGSYIQCGLDCILMYSVVNI